jgi:hypothetical protein
MTKHAKTPPEKAKPTYILKLLRKDGGGYGAKVGVTFETERGNQRIVWDVIPSSVELAYGTLVFVPYGADAAS